MTSLCDPRAPQRPSRTRRTRRSPDAVRASALSREHVDTLAADIAQACLADKGGAHKSERKRVKTSTGY